VTATLSSLSRNWLEQTRDGRPSAFWFWNADMEPGEMAANDIREFLVHPIHGLEIEYLTSDYFDRLRPALELAREHDLRVWIYDEYGWPSGVAGGKVIREHPEYRNQYLSFTKNAEGRVSVRPRLSSGVLDNVMGAPWTRSEPGYLDTLNPEAVKCFVDYARERVYAGCGDHFGEVIVGFFTDEPCTMFDAQALGRTHACP